MPETDKPRRTRQPLHAAQIADALLKLQTLQELSGLGKTSLYARIKAGELSVVRLGRRCTRVRASEAQRFLQSLGKEVA
jgi:prophage regulatory protein